MGALSVLKNLNVICNNMAGALNSAFYPNANFPFTFL